MKTEHPISSLFLIIYARQHLETIEVTHSLPPPPHPPTQQKKSEKFCNFVEQTYCSTKWQLY